MARKTPPAERAQKNAAPTVKLTLSIPVDTARKFSVHAAALGLSKSHLLVELVNTGCRRFVLSDRQKEPAPPAGGTEAA